MRFEDNEVSESVDFTDTMTFLYLVHQEQQEQRLAGAP